MTPVAADSAHRLRPRPQSADAGSSSLIFLFIPHDNHHIAFPAVWLGSHHQGRLGTGVPGKVAHGHEKGRITPGGVEGVLAVEHSGVGRLSRRQGGDRKLVPLRGKCCTHGVGVGGQMPMAFLRSLQSPLVRVMLLFSPRGSPNREPRGLQCGTGPCVDAWMERFLNLQSMPQTKFSGLCWVVGAHSVAFCLPTTT